MKKGHYAKIRKLVFTSMILVPIIPFVLIMGVGYYYFNIRHSIKFSKR